MQILLVDDDEIIRTGMRKMISKDMGEVCAIEEFANGLEALNYVRNNPKVDLIITDIRMPLMDGFQLIEEVTKVVYEINEISKRIDEKVAKYKIREEIVSINTEEE